MKNKILISLIMFGLISGGILGAKLIQAQTAELPAFQKVYQGQFDITQPGDVILPFAGNVMAHWKMISIPEIKLDNMPAISVYLKPYGNEANFRPVDSWSLNTAPGRPQAISVKEGELYIWYKNVEKEEPAVPVYFCTGEYKIVVTYTKGRGVTTTPVEEITPIKRVIKLSEGTLVKAPDGKVYRVENNKLRHIASPEVMTQKGYKWSDVKDVSADIIAQYEKGEAITIMPITPVIPKPVEEKTEIPEEVVSGWKIIYEATWGDGVFDFIEYNNSLYAMMGGGGGEGNVKILKYDGKKWSESFSKTGIRIGVAEYFAVFNNKLYAGIVRPTKIEIYVFDGNSWKLDYSYEGTDPTNPPSIRKMIVYQNQLYVLGDGIYTALVKDMNGNWSLMAIEQYPKRAAHSAEIFKNKLFIDGEIIYDGQSFQKTDKSVKSMAVFNNNLYGLDLGDVLCRYNEKTNGWESILALSGVAASKLWADNNRLYITAGYPGGPAKLYAYNGSKIEEIFVIKDVDWFNPIKKIKNQFYLGTNIRKIRVYVSQNPLEGGGKVVRPITEGIKVKLIRMKDTAGVYMVDENTGIKKPIVDSSIFKSYNYDWKDVKIVEKTEFDSYQTSEAVKLKEGTLVKAPGEATVYIVEDETLKPIASPSVMEKYNYQWDKIQEVPKNVINLHQIGEIKQ